MKFSAFIIGGAFATDGYAATEDPYATQDPYATPDPYATEAPPPPPTCAPGYVFDNSDPAQCQKADPCKETHTCAYHADCVPGANAWEYQCVCNKFGDGVNVCRDPVGCEPGAADAASCTCSSLYVGPEWSNITATWNDTSTCFYEIQIAPLEATKVGSWKIDVGFSETVTLKDVWSAVSEQYYANTFTFTSQHWNPNQLQGFNFHVTSANYNNGCPLTQAPTVTVCSSPYYETPVQHTPTDELIANKDECLDVTVEKTNAWYDGSYYKQSVTLSVDLYDNVKEWYMNVYLNDTVDALTVWNMKYDPASYTLTAADYAKNLWKGVNMWNGELSFASMAIDMTAQICYQKYQ